MTLREEWERHANEWVRWARSPEADATTWRLALPALLALVPPADGQLTVDLGCGEGRVARQLLARGHRVVGVEPSPTLAGAARAGEPPVEVLEADAAAIPLADDSAGVAVAGMVLQSVDDLHATIAEAASSPPGAGCASAWCIRCARPRRSTATSTRPPSRVPASARACGMTFHDVHRPLGAYFGALEAAGLLVDALREPVPDDALVAERPDLARWRRTPRFLLLRAIKPAGERA